VKTAISIPDGVFRKAERVAKRLGLSRSELYAKAVDSFVSQWDAKEIRAALDAVYEKEDSRLDPVLGRLQSDALKRQDW
jgi:metal-responsive CopG/Arc/MetJ family transcriptional regulator